MEKILIVNEKDKVIGQESKEKCHKGKGILHRAFSILIFNKKNQILLSKRSRFKKLWPLFWDNSCSSHPLKGKSYEVAGQKRLKEEFSFTRPLKLIDKFQYQAQYKNVGSENEICALLVGEYNQRKIKPDPKEIAGWKWVFVKRLQEDIEKNPQKYTPWLKIGLGKYLKFKMNQEKENLNLFLTKFTKIIDPVIKKILVDSVDRKFQKTVSYQISTGGKRLRPALVAISCRLLGGKLKDVLYPAAGLEIFHNYTLIVDDIIDNSSLRRGKPTCWFKFGKSVAQCIGIDYSAALFQAANRTKNPVVVSELLAKTLKIVMEGELLDILFEQSGREAEPYILKNRYRKITEKDYFKMASQKTATLFQACCEIGGICAGAKKRELKSLRNYGFNLGIAFQIQDDILDIFGQKKMFGKKIGKDIEERKGGNIVILFALKELNLANKKKLLKILRKKKINQKDIKEAVRLIKKTNSHQKACLLGQKFGQKAKKSLEILPKNKWNNLLATLANFASEREK